MLGTDLLLKRSANHPTDASSTAGGSMSGTEITNSGPGEWMPRLVAPESGAIDSGAVFQVQMAYIHNSHGSDVWADGGIYMGNLLKLPASPGALTLSPASSSDNSSKKVRVWGVREVSSVLVLDSEEIVLAGLTPVTGIKTWTRVLRSILLNATSGELDTAAGNITHTVGAEVVGKLPASYTYATSEYEFASDATEGNRPSYTNRVTPPGGLTWTRPNTEATRLYVGGSAGNDTGPDERWAIYCRQTLQPGMPAASSLVRALHLYGIAI